ncbi:MAG: hypothetical protein B7X55_06800 [Rhodobacterales bacterium 34-62-10]|nr:MAG: hypothetical protein B7X55_06800 [Rhodobacterales bacterium 34-62-10]
MSLPLWKIRRELKRAIPKTLETLAEPFRHLTFLPLYDLRKKRLMRVTNGAVPPGAEIGICLIFPDKGVLPSHQSMINAMVQQGISPLVVSNCPLTDKDRASLAATAFRVIERPNIGYDFGGYRDAILSIAAMLPDLRCLWVLNDSAWLVDPSGHWFAQARACNTDFTGCVSNFGIRKVDIQDHARIAWDFNPSNRRFHYVSSSWRIGAAILRDPAFLRFWKRLQIRDSKQLTVRRGEVGFSQWVLRHGFTHTATHEIADLPDRLAALSDHALDAVTRHLLVIDPLVQPVKDSVLASDPTTPAGRQARITLCLAATARFGFVIAMPYFILHHGHLPFFKKSVLKAAPDTVTLALTIMDDLPADTGPMIRAEAVARAQTTRPSGTA